MTTNSNLWDTDAEDFESTGEGLSALRAAYKALKKDHSNVVKERDSLASERDSLQKSVAAKSLDSLTANLPAGVKKFLTKDFERDGTEPTEANVKTWLDENGSDFGYKAGETPAAPKSQETGRLNEEVPTDPGSEGIDPNLPPEVQSALQLIQNFEAQSQAQNAGATQRNEALLQELEGNTSLSNDELLSRLAAAGAPVVGH